MQSVVRMCIAATTEKVLLFNIPGTERSLDNEEAMTLILDSE